MKAFEAILNREDVSRIVLQERPEGWYVFVFAGQDHSTCMADHLQDDLAMAKRCSAKKYGTAEEDWREVPDTGFMAWVQD